MKEQLIADMFNVSNAIVSRVIITWANFLFIVLSSVKIWIKREKVKLSMPPKFQKYCPNVRVILDCTEIALETTSSLTLQSETFSNYKNRTLKGLIGVASCCFNYIHLTSLHWLHFRQEDQQNLWNPSHTGARGRGYGRPPR